MSGCRAHSRPLGQSWSLSPHQFDGGQSVRQRSATPVCVMWQNSGALSAPLEVPGIVMAGSQGRRIGELLQLLSTTHPRSIQPPRYCDRPRSHADIAHAPSRLASASSTQLALSLLSHATQPALLHFTRHSTIPYQFLLLAISPSPRIALAHSPPPFRMPSTLSSSFTNTVPPCSPPLFISAHFLSIHASALSLLHAACQLHISTLALSSIFLAQPASALHTHSSTTPSYPHIHRNPQ